MAPPASIDLIGSYPLGTCTKPRIVVDLAVTIPAVSFPSIVFIFLSQNITWNFAIMLSCTECNIAATLASCTILKQASTLKSSFFWSVWLQVNGA